MLVILFLMSLPAQPAAAGLVHRLGGSLVFYGVNERAIIIGS